MSTQLQILLDTFLTTWHPKVSGSTTWLHLTVNLNLHTLNVTIYFTIVLNDVKTSTKQTLLQHTIAIKVTEVFIRISLLSLHNCFHQASYTVST